MPDIGQKIGPFELIEWISSDRHTSLFRAQRPKPNRASGDVAIRVVNFLDDQEGIQRVEMEYKILRALTDKHLPRAVAHYAGQGALAMQWVEGVTLREVLDAHHTGLISLDPVSSWEIITEAGHALKYVHSMQFNERPLFHGRIKPENIVLSPNGELVLLDVGKPPSDNDPAYSPPEQAVNAFIDWRTDQWALGSIAVEMLLQEKLYTGRQEPQEAAEIGDTEHWVKRIEYEWPDLGSTVGRMLKSAAGDRFQTQTEMLRAMISAKRKLTGYSARKTIASTVYERVENETNSEISEVAPRINEPTTKIAPSPIAPKPKIQNFPESNISNERENISAIDLDDLDPGRELIEEKLNFEVEGSEEIDPFLPVKDLKIFELTAYILITINGCCLLWFILKSVFG